MRITNLSATCHLGVAQGLGSCPCLGKQTLQPSQSGSFHAQKAAGFICLLFASLPLASSGRFQHAVFEERGAVNNSEVGFINGRHVITARHGNLKSLLPKCLVSFIKTKWALGMDAVTL